MLLRYLSIAALLVLSACGLTDRLLNNDELATCANSPLSDQIEHCNYLVGDSTFALVLDYTRTPGNGDPSCGFLDDAGLVRSMADDLPIPACQIDWSTDEPKLDEGSVVVIGVSIHDAMCRWPIDDPEAIRCEIDASTYTDVVDHYGQFAPVVVVEAPPVDEAQNPTYAANSNARIAELNQKVAETLGCALVPYEIRLRSPLVDGVHYEPNETIEPTALALLQLGSDNACRPGPTANEDPS